MKEMGGKWRKKKRNFYGLLFTSVRKIRNENVKADETPTVY